MNRQEAKRDACFHSAEVIQSALDAGWETDVMYPDPADHERFLNALQDLLKELRRRGEKP